MTAIQPMPPGRFRALIPGLFGVLAGAMAMAMTAITPAGAFTDLQSKLPTRIHGWQAEPADRIFDDRTIFSYIDGAAEVYRAYNLKSCLSRRYTKSAATAIILDIFDMGTGEDAFGVFTHDTDGERLEIRR